MLSFSLLLLVFYIRASLCELPLLDRNSVLDLQVRPFGLLMRRSLIDSLLQSHRGGRGETVESTLPSFAW